MSEPKIARAWGAACIWQAVIAFLVLAFFSLVFAGLALMVMVLPIPQTQRPAVIFGGLFITVLIVTTGVLAWGAYTIRRRALGLDSVFNPMGLTGSAYLLNGRQYHGMVGDRQVDVYIYRGPSLDLYFASPLHTRMGIGLKGQPTRTASRISNQPELISNDAALSHLAISSLDERWGRELLEDPQAREVILQLVAFQPGLEFRNLLFQPEALQLQIYLMNPGSLSSDNLRRWVDDLARLADIAESIPAPIVTSNATPMEQRSRTNRGSYAGLVMGITCTVFLFFTLIAALLIVGLLALAKAG